MRRVTEYGLHYVNSFPVDSLYTVTKHFTKNNTKGIRHSRQFRKNVNPISVRWYHLGLGFIADISVLFTVSFIVNQTTEHMLTINLYILQRLT
jgi:hypothetical protein